MTRSTFYLVILFLASPLPVHAESSTIPLKSFGYQSLTVSCDGKEQLLRFDTNRNWKMAPEFAAPGAGKFPQGSRWDRAR